MSFQALGLPDHLLSALNQQNISTAYPIQKEVIPKVLDGRDILGIAKTGSGKTLAYVLPILAKKENYTRLKNRHVNTLVLVPTRELAAQVYSVFNDFSKNNTEYIKCLAVYGGVSINPQMQDLQNVNVLIATPGRLLELIQSNAVHLSNINMLVIDEADKMLNLGFKDEMDKIFSFLPKKQQNLLFSATLNDEIYSINNLILNDPQTVKIQEDEQSVELIEQTGYFVDEEKKGPLLRHLIKVNNFQQVLVFTSSTYKADNVADKLRKNGIDAKAIHGKKSQLARNTALYNFKNGELRVLVATDLLGRGIDIEFLPLVINYELPRSPKDYIHRIGRTGRAGKPGIALSFVSPNEHHHFKVIQKKIKKTIEMINSESIKLV